MTNKTQSNLPEPTRELVRFTCKGGSVEHRHLWRIYDEFGGWLRHSEKHPVTGEAA